MSIQDEIKAKHQRVKEALAACELDGVLLTRRCNFSWYTSGAHNHVNTAVDAGTASLLVTADGATLLTNNIEAVRFRGEDLAGRDIAVVDVPWHDNAARIGAYNDLIAGRAVAADVAIPGVKTRPWSAVLDEMRWTLLDAEIERYRQLSVDVAASLEEVATTVTPGATEWELAGLLSAILHQRGCLPLVVLVAGEGRVPKYRHPLPTTAPVNKYGMLVTCAERDGLIAAVTRLFYFGKPPAELAAKHRAVVTVDAAMIDATRPGATLGGVLDAGIAMYREMGFADEWRLHHQGGSCGYQPREIIATPGDTTAVLAGQAFAWNPSITGTKSEDTILCRPDGPAEILSATDDWPVFDVEINGTVYQRPDILAR
ncbi:MAG: aminopeptidase P family protein [Planctomycetes bacterium]|nr:aminopeptidase P family protein [Planctomycetota bacterium]